MEDFCEGGRGFRQRRKTTAETICPICEVTLKSSDLENHYQLEVDRLMKLQLNSNTKKKISNGNASYHEPTTSTSTSSTTNGNSTDNSMNLNTNDSSTVGCPWIKFQKIRSNRHQRLKIKNKKRKIDDPVCPICNEQPNEDINVHVEMCLRKNDQQNKRNGNCATAIASDDDDESIDIEGECDTYEEYEWAGQKRIRVSSLIGGGYSSLGIGSNVNASVDNNDEDDEDLNVDGDLDTQTYGPSQYTEKDVIVPLSDECDSGNNENLYLRQLVAGESGINSQQNQEEKYNSDNVNGIIKSEKINMTITNNKNFYNGSSSPSPSTSISADCNNKSTNQIVESLKLKIIELENQINNKNSNKIKCLICMDEFYNPAISICCWHVHCEECWLRTLGTRKLCPQCNMITSPKDLRRIYM